MSNTAEEALTLKKLMAGIGQADASPEISLLLTLIEQRDATIRAQTIEIERLRTNSSLAKRLPLGRTTRWTHRKRKSNYDVLTSVASAQCATGPINEGDQVTIYVADDDSWWVRKTSEFLDGRFERGAPNMAESCCRP